MIVRKVRCGVIVLKNGAKLTRKEIYRIKKSRNAMLRQSFMERNTVKGLK